MAKFKYLGKDNTLVGRFGRLKKGDVVELWETEAEYVLMHPSDPPTWVQVKQADDMDGVGKILPAVTKHFDLTRVFWLREAFAFLSRQSRSELLAITRAFREIGAKVSSEQDCQCLSRDALKEHLYSEVKRLRWTESNVVPEPVATKQSSKKTVEPKEEEPKEEEVEESKETSELQGAYRERGRPLKKVSSDDKQKVSRAIRREK